MMIKRSCLPLEFLTKMQDIWSSCSNSVKTLVLNLVSLILYEVFSLLIFLGAVQDTRSSKFNKFVQHKKLIYHSIKRRTNWEMRRTLVSAPEVTPTYDCGALLLGAVLIFHLYRRKKIKFQEISNGRSVILAK